MNRSIQKFLGNKNHLGRRYFIFLIGLFICSFGVACTTKASLGTSPVASIPYTLALIYTDLSFGNWLILFCMFQILVQIILLRRNCVVSELIIQTILAFAYGYLTDFSMFILKDVYLTGYVAKLGFLLLGCAVMALGVYLELVGDVGMLSGDAFIKAIAQVTEKPYSTVKVITDVSMSILAGITCIVFLGKLEGVREGTLIAAFLVGYIIKKYQSWFKPAVLKILPE